MPFAPAYGHLAAFVLGDLARYYGPSVLSSSLGGYLGYKAGKLYKSYFKRGKKMPVRRKPAMRGRDPATLPGFNPKKRVRSDEAALYAEDNPGYVQRAELHKDVRWGRYLSRRAIVQKQLAAHIDRVVERYQACYANAPNNSINVMNGSNWLVHGPYGGDAWQYPIKFFDLTGVYNNCCASIANTHNYPVVQYGLKRSVAGTGGVFQYTSNYYGRNSTDLNDVPTWNTELIGTAVTAVPPKAGQNAFINGVRVNLAVYGAKLVPSKVFVELWRFTDGAKAPSAISVDKYDTTVGMTSQDCTVGSDVDAIDSFYNAFMAKSCGSGIAMRGSRDDLTGCYRKVLKVIDFNPTSSFENDATGHQRNISLNIRLNKWLKLDWDDDATAAGTAGNVSANPDQYNVQSGASNELPFPRQTSRVFLVVRAHVAQSHLDTAVTGTQLANMYPNFDIVMRRYRTSMKT